jgi:hypothetical protein
MPTANTTGDRIIEAVVAGPDGANRLFTITGVAFAFISVNPNQQKIETWTFLVGPAFTRGQLYRAIGAASVSSQFVHLQTAPGNFQIEIPSVEADWDDESGRVEMRVEVALSAGPGVTMSISHLRYWVTILAQM